MVSKTFSNAWYLFEKGESIDDRAELQKVESCTTRPIENTLHFGFTQPASSVSFVEMDGQTDEPLTMGTDHDRFDLTPLLSAVHGGAADVFIPFNLRQAYAETGGKPVL